MPQSWSRTPQGVRGLKHTIRRDKALSALSHSARSAWIETLNISHGLNSHPVALRKECVD